MARLPFLFSILLFLNFGGILVCSKDPFPGYVDYFTVEEKIVSLGKLIATYTTPDLSNKRKKNILNDGILPKIAHIASYISEKDAPESYLQNTKIFIALFSVFKQQRIDKEDQPQRLKKIIKLQDRIISLLTKDNKSLFNILRFLDIMFLKGTNTEEYVKEFCSFLSSQNLSNPDQIQKFFEEGGFYYKWINAIEYEARYGTANYREDKKELFESCDQQISNLQATVRRRIIPSENDEATKQYFVRKSEQPIYSNYSIEYEDYINKKLKKGLRYKGLFTGPYSGQIPLKPLNVRQPRELNLSVQPSIKKIDTFIDQWPTQLKLLKDSNNNEVQQ